jgi:hypothetical protein
MNTTPTDWKISKEDSDDNWAIITDSHGNIIANVNTETGPTSNSFPTRVKMPAKENAALISAAPEMLAVIERALREDDELKYPALVREMERVIAKAKGEV